MGRHTRAPKKPLVLTDNDEFLVLVLTLTAAAKVDVHVAPDIATARRHWLAALGLVAAPGATLYRCGNACSVAGSRRLYLELIARP